MNTPTASYRKFITRLLNSNSDDEREMMLKKYIKLLVMMTKRYPVIDNDTDDLLSTAIVALLEAWEKFDPERGEFHGYALYIVRGKLFEYSLRNSQTTQVPLQVSKVVSLLDRIYTKIEFFQPEIAHHSREIMSTLDFPPDVKIKKELKQLLLENKSYISTNAKNSKTSYETIVARAEELRDQIYIPLELDPNVSNKMDYIDEVTIDIKLSIERALEDVPDKKIEAYLLSLSGCGYGEVGRRLDPPITRQGARLRSQYVRDTLKRRIKK